MFGANWIDVAAAMHSVNYISFNSFAELTPQQMIWIGMIELHAGMESIYWWNERWRQLTPINFIR